NGYFGFNWNTMYSVDGLHYPGSGYDHGAVSGARTAFNGYVGPTPPMSVTGSPFNALRFRSIGFPGDQFAMDNFTFSAVPEPHALILSVIGLLALAWRRTRRPTNA